MWWWRRTSWILAELLRERNFQYQSAAAVYYQATLSNSKFVEDDTHGERRDKALEKLNELRPILFPWVDDAATAGTAKQAAADLAEVWKTIYPEGTSDAAVDAVIAAMYAQPASEEEEYDG